MPTSIIPEVANGTPVGRITGPTVLKCQSIAVLDIGVPNTRNQAKPFQISIEENSIYYLGKILSSGTGIRLISNGTLINVRKHHNYVPLTHRAESPT